MPAIAPDHVPERLYPVIEALCATGKDVARTIARGPLGQSLAAGVGENTGGDQQKALDVLADEAFEKALEQDMNDQQSLTGLLRVVSEVEEPMEVIRVRQKLVKSLTNPAARSMALIALGVGASASGKTWSRYSRVNERNSSRILSWTRADMNAVPSSRPATAGSRFSSRRPPRRSASPG